jgi:hypothetical protein
MVDLEVKISVKSAYRGELLALNEVCKYFRNLYGRTAKRSGKAEARKSDVTHRSIRRILEHGKYLFRREESLSELFLYALSKELCGFLFKYKHIYLLK